MSAPSHADTKVLITDVGLSVDVSIDALRRDLLWLGAWFKTRQILSRGSKKKLAAVQRTSLKLAVLLEEPDISVFVGASVDMRKARDYVQAIAEAATLPQPTKRNEKLAVIEEQLVDELGFARRGAFEWLVGERLPKTFEKHFGKQAGFSRNPRTKTVGGPYIRFVQSALKNLSISNGGKPYSAESIARAYTHAKAGRTRKNPSRRTKGQSPAK
jgi:hypothetical protein